AQKPLTQPVDVHQHVLVGLFHLGHGMGFQTQLFSDKSFYEHLVRSFRSPWSGNHEGKPMRGASQAPSIHNLKHSKGFNCLYTFGTGTRKTMARSLQETALACSQRSAGTASISRTETSYFRWQAMAVSEV